MKYTKRKIKRYRNHVVRIYFNGHTLTGRIVNVYGNYFEFAIHLNEEVLKIRNSRLNHINKIKPL